MPWSVVKITSVFSRSGEESSSLSTMPTPWSSERALALKAATSARTSGASGRLLGGFEKCTSRSEPGPRNSRCVSKKPTERNSGCSRSRRSTSIASGATDSTRVVGTLMTSS